MSVVVEGLYKVVMKKTVNKEDILARFYDDAEAVVKPILRDIINPYREVYVDSESWDKVCSLEEITPDIYSSGFFANPYNKVNFLSITLPSIYTGYKGVLMLSANFTDSLLYKLWSNMGVEFVEFKPVRTKTGKEIPALILLGTTKDLKNEGQDLVGEFILSRWGAKLEKVKAKLGSDTANWKNTLLKAKKAGTQIEFEVV